MSLTGDEFGRSGQIFSSDSLSDSPVVQIRDDVIVFQEGNETEECLFAFPLYEIFNFLLAIGSRFPEVEGNLVFDWPDSIEKKFKEMGINHKEQSEFPSHLFDIEGIDKEFFEHILTF